MKKWIEKFKQASTPKKILFLAAVLYIVYNLVRSGVTAGEFGGAYFVTAALVYLLKIGAVFLAAKLAMAIGKKLRDRKKNGGDSH